METTTTTTQSALKWGAIGGVITVIYTLISNLMNIQMSEGILPKLMFALSLIIIVIVLYFAMLDFKSKNQGFMSYSQGLGIGALIGAIVGVISGVFNFIYTKFVDITMTERIRDYQISKLEEQGIPSEQIEASLKIMDMFSNPNLLFVAVVLLSVLFYFLMSLIVSAITKNEKPIF
jgi:hypothetical protein